jgi:hypothetical protein
LINALTGAMRTKNALDSAGPGTDQQVENVSSLIMDAKLKDNTTLFITGTHIEKSAMSQLLKTMSSLEQDTP